MPRVSIGLPVFNGENYMRQSIESVLAQTFEDFEFIISDNASTDSTADICREYAAKDKRVRYLRQPRNCGLSRNANFVFHQASGEYFKWVSHDDIHSPTFVAKCVKVLDSNPSAVLACPRALIIDGRGEVLQTKIVDGRSYAFDKEGRMVGPMRMYDPPRHLDSPLVRVRFKDLLLHTGWCLEYYGLMRSDVLRKTPLNGDFFGGDKPLLAELVLHGPFVEIPEVLFLYRQHPAQQELYRASASLKQKYATGNRTVRFEIPRVKLLGAYLNAIVRTPLSLAERSACLMYLVEWMSQRRKLVAVMREIPQLLLPAMRTMVSRDQRVNNPDADAVESRH